MKLGSGAHSLAISSVDPGTYIVLSEGAESQTFYLDDDFATTPNILTESALFSTVGTVDMAVDAAGAVTISQDTGDGSDVTNVYVQSDDDGNITVNNFENVDVQVRGHDISTLEINDAERGNINMGEGDDSVTINNTTGGGTFFIATDGGNDTITLNDLIDTTYIIDGGEYQDGTLLADDIDTVNLDGLNGNINLGTGPLDLSNVEVLNITGTGDNVLTLSAADVLDASDGLNTLIIQGDVGDSLNSTETWTSAGAMDGVDGNSYNAYTFDTGAGIATLLVEPNININNIVD
jgi:hypothetical protein